MLNKLNGNRMKSFRIRPYQWEAVKEASRRRDTTLAGLMDDVLWNWLHDNEMNDLADKFLDEKELWKPRKLGRPRKDESCSQ